MSSSYSFLSKLLINSFSLSLCSSYLQTSLKTFTFTIVIFISLFLNIHFTPIIMLAITILHNGQILSLTHHFPTVPSITSLPTIPVIFLLLSFVFTCLSFTHWFVLFQISYFLPLYFLIHSLLVHTQLKASPRIWYKSFVDEYRECQYIWFKLYSSLGTIYLSIYLSIALTPRSLRELPPRGWPRQKSLQLFLFWHAFLAYPNPCILPWLRSLIYSSTLQI